MKTALFLGACSAWLWLHVASASAGSLPSPDGRYTLITQPIVRVVDASGDTVLVLDPDTAGLRHIESSWSPDGRRVVVVEDFNRGSGVLAAWREGNAWHRAVESDRGYKSFVQALEHRGLGQLVIEHRGLSEWVSNDSIRVHGDLVFRGDHHVPYAYVLHFTEGSGTLSRGGYEQGVLKGTGYRVTER
jgi:hypothetical protein